jgi:hypothetical protein
VSSGHSKKKKESELLYQKGIHSIAALIIVCLSINYLNKEGRVLLDGK